MFAFQSVGPLFCGRFEGAGGHSTENKKWTDELYTRLRFYSLFVFPTILVARREWLDKTLKNFKYWADGMDYSL